MNIRQLAYRPMAIVLLLGGCAQEQQVSQAPNPFGEETVGTIDGAPLYAAVLERYSNARLQKGVEDLSDDEREALLEELIQFHLMSNAAVNAGYTQEPEIAADLELQRLQALSRLMATRHLEENQATDTELQVAYEQNIDRLSGPQYKARHILLAAENEAVEVIAELQAGADFQELARTHSTGPSGPSGGDLGWFSAETMVPPFAQAVTSMEVGTFTEEPVQTRFGYHVILLEETANQEPPGLDAVRADITTFVEQRKIEELLNSLRDEAVIDMGDSSITVAD